MYWQVYLHKTAIAADHMLNNVLQRAKDLYKAGECNLNLTPHLEYFISKDVSLKAFLEEDEHLKQFVLLDDIDIMNALKMWMSHSDPVLSYLSTAIINRNLFKIKFIDHSSEAYIQKIQTEFFEGHPALKGFEKYFLNKGDVTNNAYIPGRDSILIKMKDGSVKDFVEVAEVLSIESLSNPIMKSYICHPTCYFL